LVAAASIVMLLGGYVAWNLLGPSGQARVGLSGSSKPSIAILAFDNLSKDPKEDYFSEGITKDITSDLSKFRNLLVIDSKSVSGTDGEKVTAEDVGRKLGVHYVLEGSVLKRGNRVRINAQLIDSATGQHLWAERYDEATKDIWDIQDKIAGNIVGALAVRITDIEQQRVLTKQTDNFEAYELTLKGQLLVDTQSRSENFEARKLFRRAIELDPNYSTAYSGLGWTYLHAVLWGWTDAPQRAIRQARDLSQKARSLEAGDIYGRRLLVAIHVLRRQFESALVESERLIAINPNDAGSYGQQGSALTWLGRPDGAILALERALRLDPDMKENFFWHLGLAYYLKKRYVDSATTLQRILVRNPEQLWTHLVLAAVYGQMGRAEEAAHHVEVIRQIDPRYKRLLRFGQFKNSADTEFVDEGLRKAGLY
jgi:adenylate cyclase